MNVNIGVHQDATLLDELDNNSRVTVNQITIRHTVLKQFADKRKGDFSWFFLYFNVTVEIFFYKIIYLMYS